VPVARLEITVTPPSDEIPVGRGFYQLEEDTLYVQLAPYSPDHRFFNYLESELVRLDLDKDGQLLFIEIHEARRRWTVVDDLAAPHYAQPADIRWLDFRMHLPEARFLTNRSRDLLVIEFSNPPVNSSYQPAWSVIVDCNEYGCVSRIWVTDIVDDLAGQDIAAFRKSRLDRPLGS
jgi:hypothetical protein